MKCLGAWHRKFHPTDKNSWEKYLPNTDANSEA